MAIDVALDVGPRILGFAHHGRNALAELPDTRIETPGQDPYRFWGGHRLWAAPEVPAITYETENEPVEITVTMDTVQIRRRENSRHGVGKSMRVTLEDHEVVIDHAITNTGSSSIRVAPWAITQFPLGGVAVIGIGARKGAGLQANRSVVMWPYASLDDPRLTVQDDLIAVEAAAGPPLKVGAAGSNGWLAYLRAGLLFVKRFEPGDEGERTDLGASAQVYTGLEFLELETVAQLVSLSPGESVTHQETWALRAIDDALAPADLAALIEEDLS